MIRIDSVVMKEESERADRRAKHNGLIQQSTAALVWFAEHAMLKNHPGELDQEALESKTANIVAYGTTNADKAGWYVNKARSLMRKEILEKAIKMAQADLDQSREALK